MYLVYLYRLDTLKTQWNLKIKLFLISKIKNNNKYFTNNFDTINQHDTPFNYVFDSYNGLNTSNIKQFLL
jgi:transposase-like protein